MNNGVFTPSGVLLVVHGTRDRKGLAEARRALAMVTRRLAPRPVELGFIELAEPSIGEAVARLIERRVRHFTVAPLMLFAAAHVKQDIPRMVADGLSGVDVKGLGVKGPGVYGPGVRVTYAGALDCHPAVLDVSAARFDEQIDSRRATDAVLLLVGRGSSDVAAIGRFEEFAERRRQLTPVADMRVCYLAVASPSFEEAITAARRGPQRYVVIQPHLLFHGRLMQQLKERVACCRADDTTRKWWLCQHLGPSEQIVDAVVQSVTDVERQEFETGSM
jgi:sirohydrochlorin ferrochelatase